MCTHYMSFLACNILAAWDWQWIEGGLNSGKISSAPFEVLNTTLRVVQDGCLFRWHSFNKQRIRPKQGKEVISVISLPTMKSFVLVFELYFLALLLTEMEAESALECTTTDGRKGVFPFKFKPNHYRPETERTYNECTWDYAFNNVERNDKAWCGTSEKAGWSSDWGDCGEGCPIPGGEPILLSLTYDTYHPLHIFLNR